MQNENVCTETKLEWHRCMWKRLWRFNAFSAPQANMGAHMAKSQQLCNIAGCLAPMSISQGNKATAHSIKLPPAGSPSCGGASQHRLFSNMCVNCGTWQIRMYCDSVFGKCRAFRKANVEVQHAFSRTHFETLNERT